MKGKRFLAVLGVICTICELVEYLTLPAIFAVIGVWLQLPWQYYAITIGSYFAVLALGETMIWLFFQALGRPHSPRIFRKVQKISRKFSGKKQNSALGTQEEN